MPNWRAAAGSRGLRNLRGPRCFGNWIDWIGAIRTSGAGLPVFSGFKRDRIETSEATICVRHAGNGPPLLLLHGHPQTHVMWHLTAPALAQEYTVICADLRGYGDSSKPETTADHEPYSKRAMARD